MTLDEHIRIAAAALTRGLIDARGFVDAMRALAGAAEAEPGSLSGEAVWLASGRLTLEQLSGLREALGPQLGAPLAPSPSVSAAPGETLPFTVFASGSAPALDPLMAWIAGASSEIGFGETAVLSGGEPAPRPMSHAVPPAVQAAAAAPAHVSPLSPASAAPAHVSPTAAAAPPSPALSGNPDRRPPSRRAETAPDSDLLGEPDTAPRAGRGGSEPDTAPRAGVSASEADTEPRTGVSQADTAPRPPAIGSTIAVAVAPPAGAGRAGPGSPTVATRHDSPRSLPYQGVGHPRSTLIGPPGSTGRPLVTRSRYERRELLGIGGLGQVTACFDTLLGRRVAVKVARNDQDHPAELILEREARIIANLEHPNIIPVYDAGSQPGVGPYYVMRLVTQPSLETVLDRLRRGEPEAGAEYTQKRLLRYFVQICHAVDYAHNRGVVHCDLKPGNILLGSFGEVLVVDWGLAYSKAFPEGPRGGTPGFMAPEQFDRSRRSFDARTDVFALGAILYMLLCLQPAFPSTVTGDETAREPGPLARYRTPRPPSEVAPNLGVPPEVEEVCFRALALDAADRYASARELAQAIDDFLEGRRELERRRAEADRQAAGGDELAERYHELVESQHEHAESLAALRAAIPPWAALDDKLDLWNTEDMIAVTNALRVRTLQAAVSGYEAALDAMPRHEASRRGLARLYWTELERARNVRDELDQLYFEQLVRQHDDGTYVDRADGGRLHVDAPAGVGLSLRVLREQERRLVLAEERPLPPPADGRIETRIPAGRYVLQARAGGAAARYPFGLRPGAEVRIDVGALAVAGPDEAYLPAGPALLGESQDLYQSRVPGVVDVGAVFLALRPVSFAEYLAFLEEMSRRGDDAVAAVVPRGELGLPLWRRDDGVWTSAPNLARLGAAAQSLPAFGISAIAAEAYATWLSERRGVTYRLPYDREWEKAARGTDGRLYPWGDHFDPTFCKMRASRPGPPAPEPSGSFGTDVSPYGVLDMAGGVADWTLPDPGEIWGADATDGDRHLFSRGGAWADWPADCRVTARRIYRAADSALRVGFRLARVVD